jgi:hypothetical protein
MRHASRSVTTLAGLWLLLGSLSGLAATLEGVTLPDSLQAGSAKLALNGMALRAKYMFHVYIGGLYLTQPNHNSDDIIRQAAPRALIMQFVRDIRRDKLIQAYTEGFDANGAVLAVRLKPEIDRLFAFLEDVHAGDRMMYVYEPGKGSSLTLRDHKTITVPGKDFADLFLMVYIGPHPPTDDLKNGLLGL